MSYSPEWILGACVVLVAILCAPPLALLAFGVLLLAVLAALLALAGAIVATPYLLFRAVRHRWTQNSAGRWNAEPIRGGLEPVPSTEMGVAHRECIN
jgi:hypothetical protein